MTLNCDRACRLDDDVKEKIRSLPAYSGCDIILAASGCKPAGVDTYDLCDDSDVYSAAELKYMIPDCYTKSRIFTRDEYILEALDSVCNGAQTGDVAWIEFHLFLGILFGFPLGDVFGFCRTIDGMPAHMFDAWRKENKIIFDARVLAHVPTPFDWPRKWSEKVGWWGEIWLDAQYRRYL